MKEIWINLELYIKRYDFYKLGNFFGFLKLFFLFYFRFLNRFFLNNKKIGRGARVDATCHARPRGSATWTRAARVRGANIYIIYYTYIYI